MPEKKRSQKKNLRRWLSSWPAYIIGNARQGLSLAHLPVGTVVSTVRLGDHSVGKALASCPFSSGHCHSQDIWNKHQVALIWKFWCCSLCSPSASACWCSWRLPLGPDKIFSHLTCRRGSQFFISFWQAEERKIWNYSFNFELLSMKICTELGDLPCLGTNLGFCIGIFRFYKTKGESYRKISE